MINIIVTMGIPGSGKSTFAKSWVAEDPNKRMRVNRDSLRVMLTNYHFTKENNDVTRIVRDDIIRNVVLAGRDLIVDECNVKSVTYKEVCKIVKDLRVDAHVQEKVFYVPLETAVARNANRTGTDFIDPKIIENFWKSMGETKLESYKPQSKTFKAQKLVLNPYKADHSLPPAVIFDLDGTVCDISKRSPYDTAKCYLDTPHDHVLNMINLFNNKKYQILFCSGREDKYRQLTEEWLDKHLSGLDFPVSYKLFMRNSSDMRSDDLIKEEIFDQNIRNNYLIKAVVDDRLRVCKMWHALGLPLFRVGDPEANF